MKEDDPVLDGAPIRDIIILTRVDIGYIKEMLVDMNKKFDDHERRIRCLEDNGNKWAGKAAAIGFVIMVLLQLISIGGGS